MKKKQLLNVIAIVALFLVVSSSVKAQSVKGQNLVNAGIGIGSFGFTGSGAIPITASLEHGFTDNISAGGFVGLASSKYYGWKYKYFVVGAKGSYHLNDALKVNNPKLDVYGGLSLYYRGYSVKGYDYSYYGKSSGGSLVLGIHAGTRYMFAEKVGAYAELGYNVALLQLGVTFKF